MAFLSKYSWDIFITYCRLDNPISAPWVTRFREILTEQLDHRVAVFFDDNSLRGNHELPPHIAAAASSSALLLVVMSATYAKRNSTWCLNERRHFHNATQNRSCPEDRVFVVDIGDVAHESWPDQFRQCVGYPFFERSPQVIAPINLDFQTAGRPPAVMLRLKNDLMHRLKKSLCFPSKWVFNLEPAGAHFFVREPDHMWRQQPIDRQFKQEDTDPNYLELQATDGSNYGIRLYDDHCDVRDGNSGWGRHGNGMWNCIV